MSFPSLPGMSFSLKGQCHCKFWYTSYSDVSLFMCWGFYWFQTERGEGERETLSSHFPQPLHWVGAHKPGIDINEESNLVPLGAWNHTQQTEPHWQGLIHMSLLNGNYFYNSNPHFITSGNAHCVRNLFWITAIKRMHFYEMNM